MKTIHKQISINCLFLSFIVLLTLLPTDIRPNSPTYARPLISFTHHNSTQLMRVDTSTHQSPALPVNTYTRIKSTLNQAKEYLFKKKYLIMSLTGATVIAYLLAKKNTHTETHQNTDSAYSRPHTETSPTSIMSSQEQAQHARLNRSTRIYDKALGKTHPTSTPLTRQQSTNNSVHTIHTTPITPHIKTTTHNNTYTKTPSLPTTPHTRITTNTHTRTTTAQSLLTSTQKNKTDNTHTSDKEPLNAEQARIHEHKKITAIQKIVRAQHETPERKAQRTALIPPNYQPFCKMPALEQRHLIATRQIEAKTCGLHTLANINSINQCIKNKKPITSQNIQKYHDQFYEMGRKALELNGRIKALETGLSNGDIMVLAKDTFHLNNCCLLLEDNKGIITCQTTSQSLNDLRDNQRDTPDTPISDNHHIHAMIKAMAQTTQSGAVHFVCGIRDTPPVHQPNVFSPTHDNTHNKKDNDGHWIALSLIQEKHNNQQYSAHTDSNNTELPPESERSQTPCDTQKWLNLIKEHFGPSLLHTQP